MTIFMGIAEFERTFVISRTNDGMVAAQARRVAFGRPKRMRPDQQQLARELVPDGKAIGAVAGTFNVTTPRRFTASSTDRRLMLFFCSSQRHRLCRAV